MRFPKLVLPQFCNTEIMLTVFGEGLTQYGEQDIIFETKKPLKCNYQDGGRATLNDDQKYIEIYGRAYFDGDICPDVPNITSGYAIIHGMKREINRGYKRRNPDGTVNYTEVELL